MVVELRRHAGFYRGVARVVRSQSDLVDQNVAARVDEQLHGDYPGCVDSLSDRPGQVAGPIGELRADLGGHDQLGANAFSLQGRHERVRHVFAVAAARRYQRHLDGYVHVLLYEQAGRPQRGDGRLRLGGAVDDYHGPTVVAAAAGLDHHRPAVAVSEGDDIVVPAGSYRGEGRHGESLSRETLPGNQFVLGEQLGVRARLDSPAGSLERCHPLVGYPFVVEGHHVRAPRQCRQGARIVGLTVESLRSCGDRRIVLAPRQDDQFDAQVDSSLVGHPGKLAGADHSYYGGLKATFELRLRHDRDVPRNMAAVSSAPRPTGAAPVEVVMGSASDLEVMRPAVLVLRDLQVPAALRVISAHRTPADMIAYGQGAADRGVQVIVAGAGGAAHLPGMLASVTRLPVIGVPVPLRYLDGMDSLLSIVQMPAGVPVATVGVGNARNAGLLAARILALADTDLASRLEAFAAALADTARGQDASVAADPDPATDA